MSGPLHVSGLHIYPVKSFAGNAVADAVAEPWGLKGDRRWMVVDGAGVAVTQREYPVMVLVTAQLTVGGVRLAAPGFGCCDVDFPAPDVAAVVVNIWRDTVVAAPACEAACAWLSAVLGCECRLVYLADTLARPVDRRFADGGETVSFADGLPVLLANEASLADLNARLARSITMARFRPNVVITGAGPWAEDCWRVVRIGGAVFRVVKPCDRCVMTTIDPETGTRPDKTEPLRTLGEFRRAPGGVMFGQNLLPQSTGRIGVGDAVEILEMGPSTVAAADA